jgi:cytochrome c biogenesis protein CcmG/thiol:disulfide interchange protein DsbE
MDAKAITSEKVEIQQKEDAKPRSRKRSIITFVVVSLLNVGLLIVLWTQLLTPRSGLSQTDSSSTVGFGSSPLIGKPAPDITLPVLNGNGAKLHLASLKGKIVMVNFWASWCQPCQQEASALQQLWTRWQSKGVVLLGVDGPESESDALNFVHQHGITYQNVRDTIDGATAISYGATANPETFFINQDGIVVARWIGPIDEQRVQAELTKLHIA